MLSSWTPLPLSRAIALAADRRRLYVGLADGRVLRSDEDGGDWSELVAPDPVVAAALGARAGVWWAITAAGLLAGREERPGEVSRGTIPAEGIPEALVQAGSAWVMGTHASGVIRSEDDGTTWLTSNAGLPYGGRGLRVASLASVGRTLFAAHALGVSRSTDAGLRWAPAGYGLPLALRRVLLLAGDGRLYAEADRQLFGLDGDEWRHLRAAPARVLGVTADAFYGLDAAGRLVRLGPDGSPEGYGAGLPMSPTMLGLGRQWHVALMPTGEVWRRRAPAPLPHSPRLRVDAVRVDPATQHVAVDFHLVQAGPVLVEIFDAQGDLVQLQATRAYAAGAHHLVGSTAPLEPGFYRCRLTADRHSATRPFAVVPLPA